MTFLHLQFALFDRKLADTPLAEGHTGFCQWTGGARRGLGGTMSGTEVHDGLVVFR